MKIMIPSFKPTLLAVAGLALVALNTVPTASAAVIIAQYDFEAGTLAPTTVGTADGFTASNLFEGTEFAGNALATNTTGDTGETPFASAEGSTFNSASVTLGGGGSPATGSFDFTVTNTDGIFSITEFALKLNQQATNPTFTVTSSVSGATTLATGTISGASGDRVFNLVTFDPTTVAGNPFTDIAANTPVTFTVSISATDTTGSVFIDKIDIQGSVIPEPTTIAMLMGGFGSLLLLRRRRA